MKLQVLLILCATTSFAGCTTPDGVRDVDVGMRLDGSSSVDVPNSPPESEPPIEPAEEALDFRVGARFSDIGQSWARDLIASLGDAGTVAGYRDGTYRPNTLVTRAELAALLVAAFPDCQRTEETPRFGDIESGFWASEAIEKAAQCGMLRGYPGGEFRPATTTTRLEAVVAIHGALRAEEPEVRAYVDSLEGTSPDVLKAEVRQQYFDVERIGAWAHAALLSATRAGMVILGEDRLGIERGERRVFRPSIAATRADLAALLYGATVSTSNNGYELAEGPSPTPARGFRGTSFAGGGLRAGEWVMTFDDGPRAHSGRIARTLRERNVTAAFFMVTEQIGWIDNDGVHLRPNYRAAVADVLSQGHVVANHMHRHCIHGLSCEGQGVAELSRGAFEFELEGAHRILRAMVADAGYAPHEKQLHFFRAPGGSTATSWSQGAANWANNARVPSNYYGNISWDLPARGHDHSVCWGTGESGPGCAQRYLSEVDRTGTDRGVILIHDNMPQSEGMVAPLIDGIRARGGRFVHPRCIVGCSR